MSQIRSLKDQVKLVTHSLLVPHSHGLQLDRFLKEYLEIESQPLPLELMGFSSPLEFLRSIPETVKVTTLPSGHVLVQAVINENVLHIHQMVKGQKKNKDMNVKFISNLLRRQPFLRTAPMHSHGGNSTVSYQQPFRFNQNKGSFTNGNANIDNQKMMPVLNLPVMTKEISPLTRANVSIDYERQLVANLQKMLMSFPNGVELSRISSLHEDVFNSPIMLDTVETGLKPVNFFENHADKFFVWKNVNGTYWVCLKEFKDKKVDVIMPAPVSTLQPKDLMRQAEPIKRDAIVKKATGCVPVDNDELVPITWTATDVRVQNSNGENLQTRILNAARDVKSVSSSVVRSFRNQASFDSNTDDKYYDSRESNIPVTFGLEKPKMKNVVTPTTVLLHQEFPPNLDPYEFFFVIVAEVYSPGKFFWFLNENRRPIESLTDDMVTFYNVNPGYEMTRSEMYIGQTVASMYTDGLFYRARIVGTYQRDIQVFYIDYGSSGVVSIKNLRHLHLCFTKLPVQAFLGRIFGIQPYPDHTQWSLESGQVFHKMIKGCKTMAAAKMKKEVRIIGDERTCGYVLTLVDTTQENEDIHVADHLVDNRLAAPDEDEIKEYETMIDTTQESTPSNIGVSQDTTSSTIGVSPKLTSPFPLTDALPTFPDNFTRSTSSCQPIKNDIGNLPAIIEKESKNLPFSNQNEFSSIPRTANSTVSSKRCGRRFVKQLVLSNNLKLHIIKDNDELYLAGPDMMMLVPNFEQQMSDLKMRIEVETILSESHPHIFLDCVRVGTPWIRDSEGELIGEIILFSLRVVSPLLSLFRVKNKEIFEAIEAQMKNPNDSFFS